MGAQFSCVYNASVAAKILDWDGNLVQRLTARASVAELMLESPGHLVVSAEAIRRTRKVSAMGADEELRPGGLYVLVPAGKSGSRVTQALLAAMEGAARRRRGRKGTMKGEIVTGKVHPEERNKKRERGWELNRAELGFPECRLRVEKRWIPVLDSIGE